MLSLLYTTFTFKKHIKTGIYVDHLFKVVSLSILSNFFIWASLYVGEKFIIEYLTRYVNNFSTNTNLTHNNSISVLTTTIK